MATAGRLKSRSQGQSIARSLAVPLEPLTITRSLALLVLPILGPWLMADVRWLGGLGLCPNGSHPCMVLLDGKAWDAGTSKMDELTEI